MASPLFLDTAGWFAALSPKEAKHDLAKASYADAARRGALLVTTPLVAAEMHTLLLRWRGPAAGAFFLEAVFDSGTYVIHPLDDDLIQDAIAHWIRKFADKPLSLADAVSFEVMQRERITRALTLDHHFAIAGFETL